MRDTHLSAGGASEAADSAPSGAQELPAKARSRWPRRIQLDPGLSRRRLLPLLLGLSLVGCGAAPRSLAPRSGHQPLKVMASVLPVTLFTRTVAAGCARVDSLVPAHLGPHDWQASPADLARLSQADVLVINGLGLESQLDKLIEASGNSHLRQIDSSRGVVPIASPAAGHDVAAGPLPSPDSALRPSTSPAPAAAPAGEHSPPNPHIWLDPRRAAQQVATIRDGLIAADPACHSRYRANASALLAELQRLDRDLERRFAPHAGRTLLMFHAIAPYFAQRYRLQSEALVDDPEQSPSAADLQRFSRRARQSGVRALLSEPQAAGNKAFVALAGDLGLPLVSFDPIETAPADPGLSASFYLDTMRRNGQRVLQALGR